MGRYVVLETIAIADCAMDIEADSLEDLFATAARALAETMVDPTTLGRDVQRRLELTAPALDLLLFDWLAELIFFKDSAQEVFPAAEVAVTRDDRCRLTARLAGGVIDRARTELRADVKAPTFHQLALGPVGEGWRARVVLDI